MSFSEFHGGILSNSNLIRLRFVTVVSAVVTLLQKSVDPSTNIATFWSVYGIGVAVMMVVSLTNLVFDRHSKQNEVIRLLDVVVMGAPCQLTLPEESHSRYGVLGGSPPGFELLGITYHIYAYRSSPLMKMSINGTNRKRDWWPFTEDEVAPQESGFYHPGQPSEIHKITKPRDFMTWEGMTSQVRMDDAREKFCIRLPHQSGMVDLQYLELTFQHKTRPSCVVTCCLHNKKVKRKGKGGMVWSAGKVHTPHHIQDTIEALWLEE